MDAPPAALCPPNYTRWEGNFSWQTTGTVKTTTLTYVFTLACGSKVERVMTTTEDTAPTRPPSDMLEESPAQCPTPSNAAGLRAAFDSYGKRVGDGQCFALGAAARASQPPRGPLGLGEAVRLEDVLPGDILQFQWAKFFRKEGSTFHAYYAGDEKSKGAHTAVVLCVQRRAPLRVFALEQNINGLLAVTHRAYDFGELTEGTCVAYRG